jgi:hypothetical protein
LKEFPDLLDISAKRYHQKLMTKHWIDWIWRLHSNWKRHAWVQ